MSQDISLIVIHVGISKIMGISVKYRSFLCFTKGLYFVLVRVSNSFSLDFFWVFVCFWDHFEFISDSLWCEAIVFILKLKTKVYNLRVGRLTKKASEKA